MIAAVLTGAGSPDASACKADLGKVAAGEPADIWVRGRACVMAFPGFPAGHASRERGVAWIGALRDYSVQRPWQARGDFALVATAISEDELLIARGRFGGRPLYYACDPRSGRVLVCSRLQPLVDAVAPALRVEALGAHLVRRSPFDPSHTLYRTIYRVPSACVLRVGPEGVRARHQLPCDLIPDRSGRADDLAGELSSLVNRAISRSVEGVRQVGLFVSGGIDSSFLLSRTLELASASRTPRVSVINLEFGALGDDRPHFDSLCAQLGVTPRRVRPVECSPLYFQSMVIDAAPTIWPTAPFEIRLLQLARERGAAIALTGGGGDNVFNGDFRIFADQFRRGHCATALHTAANLKGWTKSTATYRMHAFVVSPILRSVFPRPALDLIGALRRGNLPRIPWAGPRLRRFIADGLLTHDQPEPENRPTDRSWLCEEMRSVSFALAKEAVGQVEASAGCTRVDPYLDDDLVEFIARLDPRLLFHRGWVRGLYRHAMRGAIPDAIRLRPDKSRFEPAFVEVLEGAGGWGKLRSLSRMAALGDYGLVEPAGFQDRMAQLRQQPLDGRGWLQMWPVLSAEAFLQSLSGPQ